MTPNNNTSSPQVINISNPNFKAIITLKSLLKQLFNNPLKLPWIFVIAESIQAGFSYWPEWCVIGAKISAVIIKYPCFFCLLFFCCESINDYLFKNAEFMQTVNNNIQEKLEHVSNNRELQQVKQGAFIGSALHQLLFFIIKNKGWAV